jgi:hypothetical protein
LLTLLIGAAGAIGQLKKKKEGQGKPDQPKTGGDLWDLFNEEIFPEQPKAKTEPGMVPEEYEDEYVEEYEPYENEQKYEFKPVNEGGKIIENKTTPKTPVIKNEIRAKEKFSLRKAVIYSEILNRKYK